MIRGLGHAKSTDLIIHSDLDEIWDYKKLNEFDPEKYQWARLIQNMYYFYFNNLHYNNQTGENTKWNGPNVTTFLEFKKTFGSSFVKLRSQRVHGIIKGLAIFRHRMRRKRQIIENGGWHFSYLMSPEKVSYKLNNYAHKEYNISEINSLENINKKIQCGETLFEKESRCKKIEMPKDFLDGVLDSLPECQQFILK